jgi:hypothetical protein
MLRVSAESPVSGTQSDRTRCMKITLLSFLISIELKFRDTSEQENRSPLLVLRNGIVLMAPPTTAMTLR